MRGGNKNSGRRKIIEQRPDKVEIEKDLILGRRPPKEVAKRCCVSIETIRRFKRSITEERRRAILAEVRIDQIGSHTNVINEDMLDVARTYESLARRVEKIITKAEESEDHSFALAAMEGLRKVLRDIATMQGKLARELTVNISLSESKEWVTLRNILNEVIEEVPAAREPLLRQMRYHVLSVTKEGAIL